VKTNRLAPKEVIDLARALASQHGAEGPILSFRRSLYRPYVYGRQDVYELVSGGAVISLRFEMIADDETLNAFLSDIQKDLEGSLVDTRTSFESLDERHLPLRRITVRYHCE
jgi:hypothetical protein